VATFVVATPQIATKENVMTTTTTLPKAAAKATNPLKALLEFGQSPWMDYIRRDLLTSGGLKKMIQEDGLMGMTSNPTIFEKAITGSKDYADILESPHAKKLDAKGVYEKIAIRDVQDATDIFKAVYQQTKRRDGYVSLEVAPTLANDTQGTIDEARRLWKSVGRENVMIKVPGTKEGLPAIRQLLEEGININITLLFALSVYEQVAEAYFAALEARVKKGQDISKIASVASFFVSRIDTLIDSQIEAKLKTEADAGKKALLAGIEGKVAIANAKLTYKKYQDLVGGARWKALAAKGAQPQRLLWASTSTKNPKYRDVLYVEELIGAETVDTIPPATFDAFRDHGRPRASLTENLPEAAKVMANLEKAGISMKEVTEKLVVDGVKLFADAFKQLLEATGKTAGVRA
jgi:transaldolase